MKAEIVAMTADAIDHAALARGGEILKQGGLVAFPIRNCLRSWRKCAGSYGFEEDICSQGTSFG